jgi:hypothetical protein
MRARIPQGTSLDDLNLQVQFTNGVLGLPKLHGYVRIVAVARDADALPVRAIAETPNAQRMGAALTFAALVAR